MPAYMPTFSDDTPASNLAASLRRIAVDGVPKRGAGASAIRDDVSDAAGALANRALELLGDHGSAGLADWLVMRLASDTQSLWVETTAQAPAKPVSAPRFGVERTRPALGSDRHFSARVSLPRED